MSATTLKDKVVLVTGATGAAGQAVVGALHRAGASVVLCSRDVEALEQLASRFASTVETAAVDLRDPDRTTSLIEDIVYSYGRLDGVVHLVGGWYRGGVDAHDPALYTKLLEHLAVTTANVTTAANSALLRSGGRFVAVAAAAAARPTKQNVLYTSAKTAAEQWVLALADAFNGSEAAAFLVEIDALGSNTELNTSPERLAELILGHWGDPLINAKRVRA